MDRAGAGAGAEQEQEQDGEKGDRQDMRINADRLYIKGGYIIKVDY